MPIRTEAWDALPLAAVGDGRGKNKAIKLVLRKTKRGTLSRITRVFILRFSQLGLGSRALYERAEKQAYFLLAAGRIFNHGLIPVPGGVLVRDTKGALIGAVGISGDNSDNDELAAIAGIEAAGFAADPG